MSKKTGMEMLKAAASHTGEHDCSICMASDYCGSSGGDCILTDEVINMSEERCNDERGKSLSFIYDKIIRELNDVRELECDNSSMKKPLDKDGKALSVDNEIVLPNGRLSKVIAISESTVIACDDGMWICCDACGVCLCEPKKIMPDTQERINEDMWLDAVDYCKKYNLSHGKPKHCGKVTFKHLLSRQRKLCEK